MRPPIPPSEPARLVALRAHQVLDTAPEEAFDAITALAARIADAPTALVSLVDDTRQWFKSRVGFPAPETPREVSFCAHAILEPDRPLVVPDASADARFSDNALVTSEPGIRFYAGFPLRSSEGHGLGTLCVIDRVPRTLGPAQLDALRLLARQAEVELELRRRLVEFDERSRASNRLLELVGQPAADRFSLLERARDVLFRIELRPERRISYLNPAVKAITGFEPEALYASFELGLGLVHPDDRALLEAMLANPGAFAGPASMRWRRKDGGWVWMEHLAHAIFDEHGRAAAVEGVAREMRPERAERAGAVSLLENAPEVVTIVDAEGRIRFESPSAESVLGYRPEELVGKNAFDYIHAEDLEAVTAIFRTGTGIARATERREFRVRHKDGSYRVLEAIGQNLIDDPRVGGVVIYSRDMTARREAEAKLREQEESIARLAESRGALVAELTRAQRQRAELAALIVHDLKNPISGIRMAAQMLLQSAAEGEDAKLLQVIEAAAARAQRMVLDILDLSRSEDGALVPRPGELDLAALLEEVATEGRASLDSRKAQRILVDTRVERRTVRADRDLLRRVLVNLVENACKYTPSEGAIRLEADSPDADSVEIRVRDEGPGIPDAYRQKIFEKYARLERDVSAHAGSSHGLGLVFCRLAVEAHGGRIWVEENAPRGSCFRVRLPVKSGAAEQAARAPLPGG